MPGRIFLKEKPGDDCKCRRKCYEVIGEDERLQVFSKFISLNTKNEQDCYLQTLMSTTEVKQRRRRKTPEESSKPERGATFLYEISTPDGKHQVCKLAFMNIHSVTSERLRRLGNLLKAGKLPQDQRGRNVSGNAKPESVINMVKEHISSYPTKITHYGNTENHFLNEKLSVYDMHKAFQKKYPEVSVNYKFYLKIFKTQFSLRFGLPQVDTCCTCEELQVKIKSSKV
ncbi:uncharacterized protein LOC120351551 [Nilaparvata lugens]|uniref:uncharacterized protein LOC120351551 n=1 Tax=Nilaparvata lugens TaxID=108931 RepID=UPI00193CD67F|nr:uncharacterized protein LOC120351551 [Nilaparvata lugens]